MWSLKAFIKLQNSLINPKKIFSRSNIDNVLSDCALISSFVRIIFSCGPLTHIEPHYTTNHLVPFKISFLSRANTIRTKQLNFIKKCVINIAYWSCSHIHKTLSVSGKIFSISRLNSSFSSSSSLLSRD